MTKEERKNMLLTLPIETLVDLIIAGDEIEQRVFKTIEYIKDRYDYEQNVLTHTFDRDNIKELYEILKGEDNE